MTTQEVANKLVELCRQGKIEETQKELFAEDVESIEPDESMGAKEVRGLDAILEKGKMFSSMIEEFHGATISEPLVAGHFFSISWSMDVKMKGMDRQTMEEVCVYKVQDGKIVSEQFFF